MCGERIFFLHILTSRKTILHINIIINYLNGCDKIWLYYLRKTVLVHFFSESAYQIKLCRSYVKSTLLYRTIEMADKKRYLQKLSGHIDNKDNTMSRP